MWNVIYLFPEERRNKRQQGVAASQKIPISGCGQFLGLTTRPPASVMQGFKTKYNTLYLYVNKYSNFLAWQNLKTKYNNLYLCKYKYNTFCHLQTTYVSHVRFVKCKTGDQKFPLPCYALNRTFAHLINVYEEYTVKSQFGKFDLDHKFH